MKNNPIYLAPMAMLLAYCSPKTETQETTVETIIESAFVNPPLVSHMYTADPSAHVFEGKIYIYPSHDVEGSAAQDDMGSHFEMKDYHVFSMDDPNGQVRDHGTVLAIEDIPWAGRQLWAPDAAEKDGKYYLYFPAKDKNDVFKIGVAVADNPAGPFTVEPEPIKGSYSIDPAVYKDADGSYYLYAGGIWGGQLQRYKNGKYQEGLVGPTAGLPADGEPALGPYIAKLSADMKSFAETPKEIKILDEAGNPLLAGDNNRRFFEAAWVHKYGGKYYLSYSTGDTHFIAYATSDNPYGPFTYQGIVLHPVQGWTNHHSIVEWNGKWYLFYHDTELSGETHLRNIKMTELVHKEDGTIEPIFPMKK